MSDEAGQGRANVLILVAKGDKHGVTKHIDFTDAGEEARNSGYGNHSW